MTDLSIEVNGMRFPNPFVLASGPPGTNGKVIKHSFGLGWGGIVCKTISLENEKVHNVVPRYGRLRGRKHQLGELQLPVIVTYHPAYLLRSPTQKRKAWQDLVLARQVMQDRSL